MQSSFISYHWIEQFPQTPIEEFRSSLFFFPPPTISWTSLFVKSLPSDPIDGRPGEESGNGGTEMVKLLGETDLSVDPEKYNIDTTHRQSGKNYAILNIWKKFSYFLAFCLPIEPRDPDSLMIFPESFVLTVTAGIESPVYALPLLLLDPLRIPSELADNVDFWLILLCINNNFFSVFKVF